MVTTSKPIVGTAGFFVLDIVEPSRGSPQVLLFAGGTAGNVAVVLSSLGWESYPFARFPHDDAGFAILAEDLRRFGVHEDFLHLTPTAPFPFLVQRKRARGSDEPVFSFRCPQCNERWRGWSSITKAAVNTVEEQLPRFDVFLIDRYTPGNLALAARAQAAGARIVFEPSSINEKDRAGANRFPTGLRAGRHHQVLGWPHRRLERR